MAVEVTIRFRLPVGGDIDAEAFADDLADSYTEEVGYVGIAIEDYEVVDVEEV